MNDHKIVETRQRARPPISRIRTIGNPATREPANPGQAMKSQTEYLTFNVPARMAFLNITPQVEEVVRKSGVQEGLVLVNAMHITANVLIHDNEIGPHPK